MNCNQDTKEKIIEAAGIMIKENTDVNKITVRGIAKLAGVGTGLINYYFGSKDNLLAAAIEKRVDDAVAQILNRAEMQSMDPAERIKNMLDTIYELFEAYEKLAKFMLTMELQRGSMQVELYLIPMLKELFQNKKNELELRIIALQILQPLQVAIMSASTFKMYSGVDIYKREERRKFIDTLVNNVAGDAKGDENEPGHHFNSR